MKTVIVTIKYGTVVNVQGGWYDCIKIANNVLLPIRRMSRIFMPNNVASVIKQGVPHAID